MCVGGCGCERVWVVGGFMAGGLVGSGLLVLGPWVLGARSARGDPSL